MWTPILLLLCGIVLAVAKPIPIILDTDIGDDFDDSWALTEAISCPMRWDVKMVLTAAHNTEKRAQIVAKYLTIYNRTDIPIGIGVYQDETIGNLYPWAQNFNMSDYVGVVYKQGLEEAVRLILSSEEPLTIVGIAPMTNLGTIAKNYPEAVRKVKHVYAMMGSINVCYGNQPPACAEYNAREDAWATQAMISAGWPVTFTPVDSCDVAIGGEDFQRMLAFNRSDHLLMHTALTTMCLWEKWDPNCHGATDTLFDPTAMYMSWYTGHFEMELLDIVVTEDGYTVVDPSGTPAWVAIGWKPNGTEIFYQDFINMISAYPLMGEYY